MPVERKLSLLDKSSEQASFSRHKQWAAEALVKKRGEGRGRYEGRTDTVTYCFNQSPSAALRPFQAALLIMPSAQALNKKMPLHSMQEG